MDRASSATHDNLVSGSGKAERSSHRGLGLKNATIRAGSTDPIDNCAAINSWITTRDTFCAS